MAPKYHTLDVPDHLVGNRYFIPIFVFYTESIMFGPRFIPESVFYAQSVVRSPQSIFYTDRGKSLAVSETLRKIGEEHFERNRLSLIFSFAVFRAAPQLTERLGEAIANLFVVPHFSIIFRPKSFSGCQ